AAGGADSARVAVVLRARGHGWRRADHRRRVPARTLCRRARSLRSLAVLRRAAADPRRTGADVPMRLVWLFLFVFLGCRDGIGTYVQEPLLPSDSSSWRLTWAPGDQRYP